MNSKKKIIILPKTFCHNHMMTTYLKTYKNQVYICLQVFLNQKNKTLEEANAIVDNIFPSMTLSEKILHSLSHPSKPIIMIALNKDLFDKDEVKSRIVTRNRIAKKLRKLKSLGYLQNKYL